MRPRKIILCVDADESRRSVLAYMLSTNGFRVLKAATSAEAVHIFSEACVDLVLTDCDLTRSMDGDRLVTQLKKIASHIPMILVGDLQKMEHQLHHADALLSRKDCPSIELLERIRIMSARKRGPRKGSHRIQPQSVSLPPAPLEAVAL